ncbi:MAG: hypothetical protein JNL58_17050 [Planctomyces sp.]|nr:hypothetical protein [Planctomyces sp.]
MSDLSEKIRRARARLFGTTARDVRVPFQLNCDCGHRVGGIRQTSSQIVTCSQCSAQLFVLPVNVYPTTRRVPSEVLGGRFHQRLISVVKDLLPFLSPASAPSGRPSSRVPDRSTQDSRRAGSQQQSEGGRTAALETRERLPQGTGTAAWAAEEKRPERERKKGEVLPNARGEALPNARGEADVPELSERVRQPLMRRIRRQVTPFRLLMLAVTVVIATTAGWMYHRRQLEQARIAWRSAMDETEVVLGDRNFGQLEQILIKADQAARVLGRMDLEVGAVRNLLRQTTAINGLNSDDLYSELSTAYSPDGRLDSGRVDGLCRDVCTGWHVFECRLSAVPESEFGIAGMLELDYPMRVHSHKVRILADSSLLNSAFSAAPNSTLIFAASIESCRGPDSATQQWVIRLRSDSCALLTTREHAEQFGLSDAVDPDLTTLLEYQKQFVESTNIEDLIEKDRQLERARAGKREAKP